MRQGALALVCVCGVVAATPDRGAAASGPNLSVRAAALIEESTGQQLFGTNANQELPIASTTKLMTALVTLERTRLGKVFAEPDYYPAAADSQIGLVPGERMNVHDLMLALLLPSADDAAEALAYNVGGGSVPRFIGMMNRRARELKLKHTHYSTPIGLDTPGNYSSAADLVKLASFLLTHRSFFAHAVAMRSAVLRTGNMVRVVANRNSLVGSVPWINGVKTGHTLDAGYVLVGSGTRHGLTLVSAVLGTASESARNSNTLALLDYGFANFRLVTPVRAGSVVARPSVLDRPGVTADVIAARTFTHVIRRRARVTLRVEVPHQLAGPLLAHAVVGRVVVLAGGRPIARIPVLLARSLAAVSPLTKATRLITRPVTLVSFAALLAGVVLLVVRRRERTRERGATGVEPA